MPAEIRGVPLTQLEDPIQQALRAYAAMSDNRVGFADIVRASQLELTPPKPNSARSTTAVSHLGEVVGNLYVIAFAPFDGTGDENTRLLSELDFSRQQQLPRAARVVPRSKLGVHSEAHLTIASMPVETGDDPVMFFGNLAVLGVDGDSIVKLGTVGQDSTGLLGTVMGLPSEPAATLTVGYRGLEPVPATGERFGDPHAIFNPSSKLLQVCGFLAVSDEMAPKHLEALRLLQAVPTHTT